MAQVEAYNWGLMVASVRCPWRTCGACVHVRDWHVTAIWWGYHLQFVSPSSACMLDMHHNLHPQMEATARAATRAVEEMERTVVPAMEREYRCVPQPYRALQHDRGRRSHAWDKLGLYERT